MVNILYYSTIYKLFVFVINIDTLTSAKVFHEKYASATENGKRFCDPLGCSKHG